MSRLALANYKQTSDQVSKCRLLIDQDACINQDFDQSYGSTLNPGCLLYTWSSFLYGQICESSKYSGTVGDQSIVLIFILTSQLCWFQNFFCQKKSNVCI